MADSVYVRDVSGDTFQQKVIAESHEVLVLVDFWAPWCGPCRALAPVLSRLADIYAGKIHIAKVNTDIEQALATQFQIRGIPAVKFFRNGDVVDEFVGVQPESAIKALIDKFLPNEIDELLQRSIAMQRDGHTEQAEALLREAVTREPNNDELKLTLARLLGSSVIDHSRIEEARDLLNSISIGSGKRSDVEALRSWLDLSYAALSAPPTEALERAIAANEADCSARFGLSARLAVAGDYEQAMGQLLEIVQRDRSFRDDIARITLVGLFTTLGHQQPLTIKYRTLLARALN
jgi:putative thioredoxin